MIFQRRRDNFHRRRITIGIRIRCVRQYEIVYIFSERITQKPELFRQRTCK
jgi:hypothetical protein